MNPSALRIAGLALAGIAAFAACGDDDRAGGAAATSSASRGTTSNVAAYCDATLAIETVGDPEVDETASAEDITATLVAYRERLRPLADDVLEVAPDEIADDVNVMSAAVDQLGETEADPFEEPAVAAADQRVHAFNLANCGWQPVSLTATDYHFDGSLPTRAGATSFDVINDGDEFHLAILGRKLDSVSASAQEAFAAIESEEQFADSFEMVATAAVPPGESEYFVADLTPGEYVLFCPVPVGSTGDTAGGGPPHFTEGMVETFTIA